MNKDPAVGDGSSHRLRHLAHFLRIHAVAHKGVSTVIGLLLIAAIGYSSQLLMGGERPLNGKQLPRTLTVTDYGAKCDGVTDDGPAFRDALAAARNKFGEVVSIPRGVCRIVATRSQPYLTLTAGVTIRGVPGQTSVSLGCDASAEYRELMHVEGSKVNISGVQLVRTSACTGVMLKIDASENFHFTRSSIDGGMPGVPGQIHGMQLGTAGRVISGVRMDNCLIKNSEYGLFQTNSDTSRVSNVSVMDCTFSKNGADDLEFNAPSGRMTGVRVTDSQFRNSGGFGVGMANVQNAVIEHNSFVGYSHEAVHVEDRSSQISIRRNKFGRMHPANVPWASHIFIINNSRGVSIQNNTFDASVTGRTLLQCIYIGPGGDYPSPDNVAIEANKFLLPIQTKLWTAYMHTGPRNGRNVVQRIH